VGQCLKQHFFYWQIFANFDLKNMVSMDARDFSWKKWLKFVIFQRIFSPNYFDDKLQYVAKKYRMILFFLLSYLVYSQIWLNYFLNYCHHLHQKILKRNPGLKFQHFPCKSQIFECEIVETMGGWELMETDGEKQLLS
jgi:hypothetical protein